MQNKIKYSALILLATAATFSSCRKIFDLPDEKDYLSTKLSYTRTDFDPTLGRTTVYKGILNADNSTFPMKFDLINPHFGDGRDATDILTKKDVLVWTTEYTGFEKSVAEIEAKRKLESHPVVEIRPSGELVVWYTATSDIITPRDSVVYPQDIHYFDVRVTNSGGSRVLKDLSLTPYRELPYEPHEDINRITGMPNTTTPGGKTLVHNFPTISNMVGESTNAPLTTNDPTKGVVYTYIRKVPGGSGNSLTFKFLDKDSVEINPAKFNETKWDQLVHGFNMEKTDKYVKFEVAYPIPLVQGIPTRFTSGGVTGSGNEAHVEFSYSRLAFGNIRQTGTISQNFQIYEKGDWEIVFHFKTVNPKFTND